VPLGRVVDLFKGDQMKPEFAALTPNKEVPVLEAAPLRGILLVHH